MLTRLIVILILLASLAAPARAETRVALVIGNSAYDKVGLLPNPVRDAKAIGELLTAAGFDVTPAQDLGIRAMIETLRRFSAKAANADVALVYYAGHGMEYGGTNWLIPTDAVLAAIEDTQRETVALQEVRDAIADARRLRLIILDACRDNPFARTMKRNRRSTEPGRGLARVEPATAEIIAFAAAEGRIAGDGEGEHSPYTAALLKRLTSPGVDVRFLFGHIADDVRAATKADRDGPQVPAVYFPSIGGAAVTLVPSETPPEPKPAEKPPIVVTLPPEIPGLTEAGEFETARRETSITVWDLFIGHHPTGFYADLARQKRAKLATPETPPPPKPAEKPVIVASLPPDKPAPVGVTDCDRLAGRLDAVEKGVGVYRLEKIDPVKAISACKETLLKYPKEARLIFNLGRAEDAAKDYGTARRDYELAAGLGDSRTC